MAGPFDDPEEWGKSIRDAREEARMKQNVLAEELGMTRQRLGRMEDGYEGETPRKPNERRAISIAVAEFTGHRDRLGLSEPEPSAVDRLKKVMAEQAKAQIRLSEELAAEKTAREEMLTRIERLERGGEEAG